MVYPDWKIKLTEKYFNRNITPPPTEDKDILDLLSVLKGTCASDYARREIQECYRIYKQLPFVKEILEGCLLCEDASIDDIVEVTGLSETRIEAYEHYFFDTGVFTYRLLRFEYVSSYHNQEYPQGGNLKQWALGVGINFFKWRTKVRGHTLVPKEIAVELAGDAFYRAKQQLDEPITSLTAKEAMKWTKMALDSVSSLQKLGQERSDDKTLAEVEIALKQIDNTKIGEEISDALIIS